METKKIVITVSFILLIVIVSLIPFNNIKQVVIKASLYDVAKQINDLHNWKNWNTDLKDSNIKVNGKFSGNQSANITSMYSYSLHHINPLKLALTRNNKGSSTISTIEIASVNDTLTAIEWNEKITIFELIKRNKTTKYSRQANLDNLKKLMEDPNNKYGFFIKLVPVKDTLILTTEIELQNNSSTHIVAFLYNQLQTFIKKNGLPAEKNFFYTTLSGDNKTSVGIPVYKQTNDNQNIKFLKLPANGRLIEGIYSGKIADKRSIYNAINNFIIDQHLKQVAQPLERYDVSDTIVHLNDNTNIKIYYPVF